MPRQLRADRNFGDSGSIDSTIMIVAHGGSILIVEDELVTQRLIAASLERARVQGDPGASVAQAEAAIREVLPDLMLLDWILPGTTGVSFLRPVAQRAAHKQIPVIMLTGRTEEFEQGDRTGGPVPTITSPSPFSHQ